ncbi:hypothetical protein P7K49_032543, partial [Saguinus oedipus]
MREKWAFRNTSAQVRAELAATREATGKGRHLGQRQLHSWAAGISIKVRPRPQHTHGAEVSTLRQDRPGNTASAQDPCGGTCRLCTAAQHGPHGFEASAGSTTAPAVTKHRGRYHRLGPRWLQRHLLS